MYSIQVPNRRVATATSTNLRHLLQPKHRRTDLPQHPPVSRQYIQSFYFIFLIVRNSERKRMRFLVHQWKNHAKDVMERTGIVVKFLSLLHVTNTYLFNPILVYGPSMLPTLNLTGDVLIGDGVSSRIGKVGLGDVVVVRSPEDPRRIITKRVLGMEGDKVTFLVDPKRDTRTRTLVVPKGHIWIQGDNMYFSHDSRNFGPVPYGLIQGKVLCRVWPLREFGRLQN